MADRVNACVKQLEDDGLLVVNDGYRAKNVELSSTGLPFARAGNLNSGFDFDGADCFPEQNLHRVGNKISAPGDVVFTSKGTVGRLAFVRPDTPRFVYSPQLCFWRSLDYERIDPRCLYFWMCSEACVDQFNAVKGQTDMADYVSLRDQRAMTVSLPRIDDQRAIGRVLGQLDDKIALNRRMNETLEATARAIFRSWFVDFDPVVAKVDERQPYGMSAETAALFPDRFCDSTEGPIPHGWDVGRLGDVIDILDSKRIPLSKGQRLARQGTYPYYGAAGILDHIDGFLFDGIHVLLGEDGSVVDDFDNPVVQYVWGQFWVNNHAHVLKGRGISDEHLYLYLRQLNIRPYVTGAVQPKLNQGNMKSVPFIRPIDGVCEKFADVVGPLFAQRRQNYVESNTLAGIRDTLLPKLLSGETRLRDAETIVTAVA